MEQQNYQYQDNSVFVQEKSASKRFFGSVFLWMFVALAVSTVAAYFIASTPAVLDYLLSYNPQTGKGGFTALGYIAIFAPLGLVFLLGSRMQTMSYGALVAVFLLYSVLTGVMLSFVLLLYATTSIVICFAAATAIFLVMAIMGYTTDADLSKFGPILFAGVMGLVIISVINFFLGSSTLSYILGIVGVAIFTALTAYKVQELKRIGQGLDEYGNEIALADSKKLAIIGALSLYITFINLFMSLLRVFGNRR
ncbi:membrane protein [Pedobacter kyungheensis]|uniref:Membrane protein n=1 Tax=Pedobacter kyungheensis TaxID=1069985 RepID=A0A0C1FUA0_9SPHI|nr:Bax inhibitor-1/YccA family protein [Pedobacter kyungheensis]KIA95408.1 membrane protein [Pedobacter kyungheensis]